MSIIYRIEFLLFCLLLFFSCSRAPLKRVEDAMRPFPSTLKFTDSLSKESFFITLKKHIEVMKISKQVADPMVFGGRKIAKAKYIAELLKILDHENDWHEWINKNFDFYEVYGLTEWGEIMSTGYYEPRVYGSHQKSNKFSQALYKTPNDLVSIKKMLPYFTRKEIDEDNKLKDLNLELAWLDPIDAFFLHIQGSGFIELENGEQIHVGYDNQNGHTYVALGKYLKDIIPLEKISMQRIREYLKMLSREEQQKVLNKNPSYVFFKKLESNALTYTGMEVSNGRTIATDLNFFPKGALAFLDIEEPVFEGPSDLDPKSWMKLPRFVFDEDIGGAIRGGGRVDLYMGQGDTAAQKAGVMKQKGHLYYLVPRN